MLPTYFKLEKDILFFSLFHHCKFNSYTGAIEWITFESEAAGTSDIIYDNTRVGWDPGEGRLDDRARAVQGRGRDS